LTIADVSLLSLLPAIILVVVGVAIMVADPFLERGRRAGLARAGVGGVIAAGAAVGPMAGARGTWYGGIWLVDDYTLFFHALLLLVAGLTLLVSSEYVRREQLPPSEFVVLVLFATAGALLMSGAGELMLIFIGIEILSMGTYVLAGYRREDLRSNESALKYFLLGSFASAFFLYGVALVFGATGSTNLEGIRESIQSGAASGGLVSIAVALMLTGLFFKVALVPFHVWAPDVYEGAPTPVTGFMSVGPKAAGFAVLIRILFSAFPGLQDRWIWVIWVVAAATMLLGNTVALVQPGIKRMLAYSSIAHAGYAAVALASGSRPGITAALFYLLAYSAASLGTFTIVAAISRRGDLKVDLADYRGLASRRPALAAMLSLFLLSLAGIPATAGFAGKFFIFRAAVESGLTGLAIIGVLTTVVSFYYYLYVIVEMYMREGADSFEDVEIRPGTRAAILVAAALTLYLGILPGRVLDWAAASAAGAFALLS
jgi:NADH-quinone oxidoreductase subunit N